MSRITLAIDSATSSEAHDFVCAFQRTAGIPLPQQITTEPTVSIGGSSWNVSMPPMTEQRAQAVMREYATLRDEAVTAAVHRLASQAGVEGPPCNCGAADDIEKGDTPIHLDGCPADTGS